MHGKLITQTESSPELETVFRGSAACKPEITDPTEFGRKLLNRHCTYIALLVLPYEHFELLLWLTRYS